MKPLMGSEDFSFYLEKVPGTFAFPGVENKEKGIIYPYHHPKFNRDRSPCFGRHGVPERRIGLQ